MNTAINSPRITQRHRNVLILLWATALLLLAGTWTHVVSLSSETRARDIANAERDLSNLTRLSQEHANRTLRSADQVMRFVQSRYTEIGNRINLTQLTQEGVIDTEIFNQVGIIDAKGIYILSNRPIKERVDLSDREHFKVHKAADTGELFISKPVLGRVTGLWSIQLTRRINKPNGDFAGVVVISIDPGYFTRFYGELNLGPDGLTALYGLDGIARARKARSKEDYGTDAARATLFTRLANRELQGTYIQKSVVDGLERVFYFRKVPQYNLVTIAGIDTRFLLENYEKSRKALFAQALSVSILILALAGGLTRHLWLLRRESDARRAAQVQIEDRKDQLNAVFELSPDGFVSFDRNRCVKFVNPAFAKMTDLGTMRLDGMEERDFSAWLASLCDPATKFQGLEALRQKGKKVTELGQQTIELKELGKRILQVQLRVSDSASVSQILCLRDITHETEVEVLKSEFLATAAHELRTPMASIFGFSELLLSQNSDEETQKEFLEIIHKQSKIMVQILNELLDLARIEARRGKDFQYKLVCLQDLLADIAKAFQCPADREKPELKMPPGELHLWADVAKLRQALLNVISNAYKYSPDGGAVTVEVQVQPTQDGGSEASINVIDHGMGMTPEQVGKVFTRFYRADTSGKVPGTGLGMSITKEIMDHLKGSIHIVSAPGEGTQVSLTLPLDTSTSAEIAA